MNDLISVIVPAYNIKQYIIRCLESICAQTYLNIEIIVVDDGSDDGTAEVIDEFAATHKNVLAFHKANGGVTSARLFGVQKASGEWLGFVDGDDEIESDMYERLLSNAHMYSADISHCGYRILFADGRENCFHNSGVLLQHDNLSGLRELLSGKTIEPGLWNKLFHKDLFRKLLSSGMMDTSIKINEDLLMNFYLFQEARNTVYEDFCPYHYMIRESSATRQKLSYAAVRDPIRVRELILEHAPASLRDNAKRAYLGACIATCNRIVRDTEKKYTDEFWKIRVKIKEKRQWFPLLGKKARLFVSLILWTPHFYGPIYRFYFRTISKHPYD